MPHPLESILNYAGEQAGDNRQLASVIVKELLHYDILHALAQTALVDDLVLQGGTALRLCYGGNRYSEDLDFVCPDEMNTPAWQQFQQILQRVVSRNFGCDVILEALKPGGGVHVKVERWQARVLFPAAVVGQPRVERIHIEIAHLPAWDTAFRFIHSNHPLRTELSGYGDILLQVESETEILADKVVALMGRSYLKARDIWDLNWLLQKGIELDVQMVREKAVRYGLTDVPAAIEAAGARLRDPQASEKFQKEMSRFLLSQYARHLANAKFVAQFFNTALRVLDELPTASGQLFGQ